ncbi:SAM-dependent methyltransferase [Thermaerobacter marianensis DSM 12885]|uniref:SAM-dependent methyltransferase n=1 Tax=Thermaerobacter marianensis (strain ATCC 700841 / DSM 12885 / JCM 10246 / 7p75a) TaxID=644966 RepID=E6SMR3_THEM7|nr:class I SAM-dependent rRNA methyltransferase [Thermaerobacter marianensis]ADU51555.1 SAM-dependent methyltransferase [Thermaerobacter marianensis DSM 12885]
MQPTSHSTTEPGTARLPQERPTQVRLKPGRDAVLRQGRLWVYRTDVYTVSDDAYDPGDIVQVVDSRGRFVGKGYVNPRSMIFVRLLTTDPDEPIDRAFFRRRLERALALRRRLQAAHPDTDSFRLVFAEADLLPALIVDRFADVLVVQTLALGIDRWQPVIVELLEELASPRGIYERNDVPVRELEGLPQRAGFLRGRFDPRVEIRENGLPLVVDVAQGHKTGYFLDQRDNRAALRRYVAGARVLDAFCHTGAFTCHALAYGAREVVAVDIHDQALQLARENVERVRRALAATGAPAGAGVPGRPGGNAPGHGAGTAAVTFHQANAFDFLRARAAEADRYDVIILDPPAFAKNRQALPGAYRGYKEINLRAMKMLPPGGILITCSCSYHMTRDLFEAMLLDAARDTGRRLRILERRGAAPDHPVLLGAGESDYLKCYVVEVW